MKHMSDNVAKTLHAEINDCWNKIGVQGDLSCPELVRHIHCRNCPVYSAAAAVLLENELTDENVDERTRYFAQKKLDHTRDTHSLTVFRIGAEWLAVRASALAEVSDLRPIHTLPHHKGGVLLGLVNIRGQLLVCVSLGQLLGVELPVTTQHDPLRTVYKRLLVLQGEGGRLVFQVDEIHGIHRFHPRQLLEVPVTVSKASTTYVTAMLPWQGHMVGCLDEQLVLYTLNRSLA